MNKNKVALLLLSILLISGTILSLWTFGKKRVILYSVEEGAGVGKAMAKKYDRVLREAVGKLGYMLVSKVELEKARRRADKKKDFAKMLDEGCSTTECRIAISKEASAQIMLTFHLEKEGGNFVLTTNVTDVRKGSTQTDNYSFKAWNLAQRKKAVLSALGKVLEGGSSGGEEKMDFGKTESGLYRIQINCDVAFTDVYISSAKRKQCGAVLTQPPGTYNAVLKKKGYKDKHFKIKLPGKEKYSFKMEIEKFLVSFTGTKKALVIMNNRERGRVPLSLTLPYGTHNFQFKLKGHNTDFKELQIDKAKTVKVRLKKKNYKVSIKAQVKRLGVKIDGKWKGRLPLKVTLQYGKDTGNCAVPGRGLQGRNKVKRLLFSGKTGESRKEGQAKTNSFQTEEVAQDYCLYF